MIRKSNMLQWWEVLLTETYAAWLAGRSSVDQRRVALGLDLLRRQGPHLGRPHVDTVHGSAFANMKELRSGRSLRSFFAFDPLRRAVVLVGGDKDGDDRFYDCMLPAAEALFTTHLEHLDDDDASPPGPGDAGTQR